MIKQIIFDLDGTLLNTLDDLAASVNYVLRKYDYPEHDLVAYQSFVGNGIQKLVERALPENQREEATILKLKEEFVVYYQQHKTAFSCPYDGILDLLSQLHQQGIILAVASNKYQQGTLELVNHFFGKELFSVVLGQRENVPIKPDPSIVNDILKQTGIAASDTLYVGDSGVDMQTAKNSSITSIGVTWGLRSRKELEENGACHIVDRASDILGLISK